MKLMITTVKMRMFSCVQMKKLFKEENLALKKDGSSIGKDVIKLIHEEVNDNICKDEDVFISSKLNK